MTIYHQFHAIVGCRPKFRVSDHRLHSARAQGVLSLQFKIDYRFRRAAMYHFRFLYCIWLILHLQCAAELVPITGGVHYTISSADSLTNQAEYRRMQEQVLKLTQELAKLRAGQSVSVNAGSQPTGTESQLIVAGSAQRREANGSGRRVDVGTDFLCYVCGTQSVTCFAEWQPTDIGHSPASEANSEYVQQLKEENQRLWLCLRRAGVIPDVPGLVSSAAEVDRLRAPASLHPHSGASLASTSDSITPTPLPSRLTMNRPAAPDSGGALVFATAEATKGQSVVSAPGPVALEKMAARDASAQPEPWPQNTLPIRHHFHVSLEEQQATSMQMPVVAGASAASHADSARPSEG